MQLTTFTTPFGSNKVVDQNLNLAFSLTDREIAIDDVERCFKNHSVVIFDFVYLRQSL